MNDSFFDAGKGTRDSLTRQAEADKVTKLENKKKMEQAGVDWRKAEVAKDRKEVRDGTEDRIANTKKRLEENPEKLEHYKLKREILEILKNNVAMEIVDTSRLDSYSAEELENFKEKITGIANKEKESAEKKANLWDKIKGSTQETYNKLIEKIKNDPSKLIISSSVGFFAGAAALKALAALGGEESLTKGFEGHYRIADTILKPLMQAITHYESGTLGSGPVFDASFAAGVLGISTLLGAYLSLYKSESIKNMTDKFINLFSKNDKL